MKNISLPYFILFAAFVLVVAGCRKKEDDFDASASLQFSTDTILFDTVFTTIGSSTEYFMIYNSSNKAVNISRIYLAGGASSNFRFNVDGLTGTQLQNVEVGAKDSLFAFVEVTVDPNGGTNPMLITDSLVFETNGVVQDVDLVAYGQDAYFIIADQKIQGLPTFKIVAREGVDTVWNNTKPIVVYGYAVIDSAASLTIEEGTEVYFHNNSGLWAYIGGTLKVEGTLANPVTFQGDRLESAYADAPGQWDRIWLNESPNVHQINYAKIRNAFIGIQAEPLANYGWNCEVEVKNTIIENMSGAGILSRLSIVDGFNVLISQCQQYALALTMGGDYNFIHSTFANFWTYSIRQTPAVYINNYFKDGNNVVYPYDLDAANFTNCIIYGNVANELVLDSTSGGNFSFVFDHNLIRTEIQASPGSHWKSNLFNQNPGFADESASDFHVLIGSPALGSGKGLGSSNDLEGNARDVSFPTMGVYENPGGN